MKFLTFLIILFTLSSTVLYADFQSAVAQDDTVMAKECTTLPVIDGKADDACWADAKWQAIDQTWITWGEVMDPADFTGRYKVTWSSETDLLYFLVEVVDDVLVDGYKFPMDGYYNWDVVELFFDEDASGGDHKLNQNAFAYHITAGNDEDEFEAMDLAADWAVMNYSDHLDCKIENVDGVYVWEISMIVYNEKYNPQKSNNPTEQLEVGKVSGLSVAYCDNDDPDENPKTRDNFIGSVAVPEANHNDHWMQADWFGTMKLVAADYETDAKNRVDVPTEFLLEQNYPNPFNPGTAITWHLSATANVQLIIYNPLGQKINTLVAGSLSAGLHAAHWNGLDDAGNRVNSGVYLYQLNVVSDQQKFVQTKKMVLAR